MTGTTTTVKMQEDGKTTIPANVRRALDIYGEEAFLEIEVRTHDC